MQLACDQAHDSDMPPPQTHQLAVAIYGNLIGTTVGLQILLWKSVGGMCAEDVHIYIYMHDYMLREMLPAQVLFVNVDACITVRF